LQLPEQHSTPALQGPKPDWTQLHAALALPASVASGTGRFSPGLMGAPILLPPVDTQTYG